MDSQKPAARRARKLPPFAPLDIVEKMVHTPELTEKLWDKFLETCPDNRDICIAIVRAVIARERAWEELLKRRPDKEDFLYLFEHLRNRKMLNYYVWEVFRKRKDLTRKDIKSVLESPRIDAVTKKEAKRMLLSFPKEKEKPKEPVKTEAPEKNSLPQVSNDLAVIRKKGPRWEKPWARDWRGPMG